MAVGAAGRRTNRGAHSAKATLRNRCLKDAGSSPAARTRRRTPPGDRHRPRRRTRAGTWRGRRTRPEGRRVRWSCRTQREANCTDGSVVSVRPADGRVSRKWSAAASGTLASVSTVLVARSQPSRTRRSSVDAASAARSRSGLSRRSRPGVGASAPARRAAATCITDSSSDCACSGTRTARWPPVRRWWSSTGHLRPAPLPPATSTTASHGRPAARARCTASMPSSTSNAVIVASGIALVRRATRPVLSPRTTSATAGERTPATLARATSTAVGEGDTRLSLGTLGWK